jgi:hypothetical protein
MAVDARHHWGWLALALVLLICAGTANAQEFSVLGGASRENGTSKWSFAGGFTYLHAFDDQNALAYSWLNEGHLPGHHRDGFALQYWRRVWFADRKWALAAGRADTP